MAIATLPTNGIMPQQPSPRILLVEDQEIIQLIHQKMLVELGCRVDIAANGKKALEMIDKNYDLIFLDLGLPDISGTEVAVEIYARLQERCPRMVALTAQSKSTVEAECLASGIEQIITKPVDINTLKGVVDGNISNTAIFSS